jgi:anti-sigma regulatory factor (Ser/Thr protein kinase)
MDNQRECNDVRLIVRSDPRFLGSIRSLVRTWLEACEVAEDVVDTVVLAIDEACANAIRHAYEGRRDETLEVRLNENEEHLEFQVCDQGAPCPPECVERRPPPRPAANDLKPGGLGVPLMHEIFDEVRFSPVATGGNCVIMRLKKKD